MQTKRLRNTNHPDWPWLWQLYVASFPPGERRKADGQEAVIGHAKYHLEIWRTDDGVPIGFTACWIYEQFRFLEHISVGSAQRGEGYGTKILAEWMHRPGPVILLEIDPLVDEISRRRHGFYKRLGFCDNPDIVHSHPSYQDGTGIVPLLLLTYPEPIDGEFHREFVRLQCDEMLAHFKNNKQELP